MSEKKMDFWLFLAGSLIVGLIIGGGLTYALTKGSGTSGAVNIMPSKSGQGGDWLVKIDDMTITKSDLDDSYKMYIEQIPPEKRLDEKSVKAELLESLISQYIILMKISTDNWLNTKEGKLMTRSSVIQSFLVWNASKNQQAFIPTKPEMDTFYSQYKTQYDKSGMNSDQIKQDITQRLGSQKQQQWLAQFVSQVKESYKIQRNTPLIEKEGYGPGLQTAPAFGLPQSGQSR